MTVPEKVAELVERFEEQRDDYRSARYNETLLRRDFLDPFFTALGWDVDNRKGYSERFREVIHEYGLRVRGGTQTVDYCFRLGREPIFLVEAKKPAVDIRRDAAPAYQLRNYGWNLKLPASILTDFEEFAVYDCRAAPAKTDRAGTGRLIYWKYTEYLDHWDRLVELFSPEGIRRGGLDKFVSSKRPRKGTEPVDARFLREIESWRDVLARNLALRNKALSQRELNFAVQRTIDRTIFLRICEDRAIEPYGTLQGLLAGPNIYRRLGQLFERADDRYNSGLFYFTQEKDRPDPPDELTLGLTIDDNALKTIIKGLYEGPYNFSVLPVEILGQVYEQFLGKVIRLTKGHQAKVEEKPEVKKAGGVYYTPKYIVDYIVEHTVGKLLGGRGKSEGGRTKGEGRLAADGTAARTTKTPKQAAKLRILDPACGSGSFLLGAYQYLLDWHLEQYVAAGPESRARGRSPAVFKDRRGRWRLTTSEKKRILLNNIYGVDIDPQAVEVTKLSLLLKVLEGESQQSLERQLRFAHERALPDLGTNIKCGNSLIGPDFYDQKQMSLLHEEERYRINVFDWKAGFPEVFKGKNPGFDAVIGNPPYIRVRFFKGWYPQQVGYLTEHYQCATHVWDIYLLFFERASELARERGRISFILPIQTLHQPNCESLRRLLLAEGRISAVADLSRLRVFQGPLVKNCILVWQRDARRDGAIETFLPNEPDELFRAPRCQWPLAAVLQNPGLSLKLDLLSPKKDLCEKLRSQSWRLDELCYVTFGLRSCAKGRGRGGKERLITSDERAPRAQPYLEGRDIRRYALFPTGRFIQYIPEEMYSPRTPALFEAKKIVSQSMLSRMRIVATLDDEGYYVEQSLVCIVPHGDLSKREASSDVPLEFLLGAINSRVGSFYFATYVIDYSLGGGLVHATPGSQGKLLVPRTSGPEMEAIISAVQCLLGLHKQLAAARTPQDKTVIQRQIDATDRQIDRVVYELYNLTDEEIAIVEEATGD